MAWGWINDPEWRAVLRQLNRMEDRLRTLTEEGRREMAALDDLRTEVEEQGSVVDGAVTLLVGLKAALDAAGTDPVALAALSAQLDANTKKLADAIVANTPAA